MESNLLVVALFMYKIHIAIISWLLDSGRLLKYRLINIGYTVTRGND